MDRYDVPSVLIELGRSSNSLQYRESETINRLHDLKFKRGFSDCEHHAGGIRRIINDYMTGTINIYTLRDLLTKMALFGLVWKVRVR
jgi:hypothetical protein